MSSDMTHTQQAAITTDNYFGGCPDCGKTDGYLNVGSSPWFVCDAHRKRWRAGSNLFSDWRAETENQQRERFAKVEDYVVVEPAPWSGPDNAQDQASVLSFDQLGQLFELATEHTTLLREQRRMIGIRNPGQTDCVLHAQFARATIEIEDGHGRRACIKADPDEAAAFMAATIERRLAGVERKMTELGVTDIKRELAPEFDTLDDEIPF